MTASNQSFFEVIPLTRHIGAEVRGLDLSQPLSKDVTDAIYQAWLEHIVLVFRDQKLSQEDHVRISKSFGELGHIRRPPKFFPPGFNSLLPNIMLITNIRENGEPIGALPDGEMMFHHDMIHAEIPDKATFLYSLEVPSYGGDTLFASGYAAWDDLDPALKKKLEGRIAKNHYNYGSTIKGDSKGTEAFGAHAHPAVRMHEETGRKALYINRLMTIGFEGMDDKEAQPLLDQIFDHMEKPDYVYTHKWQVGDLIVWDNRCSTHARNDFPADQRRLMLRTTVAATQRPQF